MTGGRISDAILVVWLFLVRHWLERSEACVQ